MCVSVCVSSTRRLVRMKRKEENKPKIRSENANMDRSIIRCMAFRNSQQFEFEILDLFSKRVFVMLPIVALLNLISLLFVSVSINFFVATEAAL